MSLLSILNKLHYYPISVASAIKRAQAIASSKPTRYKLGAGGRNPSAPTPFTVRDGILGSDCIGFVLWCLGLDRYQPKAFPYYEGWINTDSAIMDARGEQSIFEECEPELGCLVIFPSIHKDGRMVRMGHVGIVVGLPEMPWIATKLKQGDKGPLVKDLQQQLGILDDGDFGPKTAKALKSYRSLYLRRVRVIDCNASLLRRLKSQAVGEGPASAMWDKPDTVWVRFKGLPA